MSREPTWGDTTQPRVLVLGYGDRDSVRAAVAQWLPFIREHSDVVDVCLDALPRSAVAQANFALAFGGDGTILRAAYDMGSEPIPVLGVNLGRLGFLAALSPGEFRRAFSDVCQGKCRVVEHLMLQCSIWRGSEVRARRLGLNEAAILSGPPYSILDIEVYVDAELATTYSCDGLIISTPVGSTAHNLSAGGPILRKDLQAFVISPISPHTLTVRPVVDSADRVFEVAVPRPHQHTSVVVDGQVVAALTGEDRVRVERAEASFPLIEVAHQHYYRTLREKLHWGGSVQTRRPLG